MNNKNAKQEGKKGKKGSHFLYTRRITIIYASGYASEKNIVNEKFNL